MDEGRILKKGGKRLLPTYDVFDETRYFEPAEESLLFELEDSRFGVTICEDIWNFGDFEGVPVYEVDPVSDLNSRGMAGMMIYFLTDSVWWWITREG
jgi:predicted amidohydrolase